MEIYTEEWIISVVNIGTSKIEVAFNSGVFYYKKEKMDSIYDKVVWTVAPDQKLAKTLFFSGTNNIKKDIEELEKEIENLSKKLDNKKLEYKKLMSINVLLT
jgi:peptidoglycan hydrolase CwlO-like protein